MKQIEAVGKSIEKAIENGLKQLNTTMENVDIKIISDGGLFSKAKVLMTLSEEDIIEEKVEETTASLQVEPLTDNKEDTTSTTKDTEMVSDEMEYRCENGVCGLKPKLKEEVDKDTKTTEETQKETAKSEVDINEVISVAKEFLSGLVYILNLHSDMEVDTQNRYPIIKLVGEDLGVLIGYRGEALESIQSLLNIIVYNKTGYKGKVIIDVENYRDRRNQTLCELATRIAKQVQKSKKSFKLEPMNSFERRVIHSHLQSFEHIGTHSEGKEPNRYLIIDYID